MEKQAKNVITPEWMEKELRFCNTAGIRSSLVALCGMAVFFAPLAALPGYFMTEWIENRLLAVVVAVLLGAIICMPVWIFLFYLCRDLSERKRILNKEFEIVTDTVTYKSEKVVFKHVEKYLHFDRFRERNVDHTTYQLASAGDVFYIVRYRSKPREVQMLFSANMYEYKEN